MRTRLYITFDHKALDHFLQQRVISHTVHDLRHDAGLLLIFFAGIAVVGIHDHGRVEDVHFRVAGADPLQILKVVVGNGHSLGINTAPEDRVGVGISRRRNFPLAENEVMRTLSGPDGIEHDIDVSAGPVLHADRHVHTAAGQPVLLVLH